MTGPSVDVLGTAVAISAPPALVSELRVVTVGRLVQAGLLAEPAGA